MMTPKQTPTLIAIAFAATALWSCSNETEAMEQDVGEQAGEAVEEAVEQTRETASEVAEETREATDEVGDETHEAVEEAGDRIESATD